MGDRSRRKGKDEKPFFGDFIEHPGSVGEMHFPYENRKKPPRDTNPLVQSHGFDWREKWSRARRSSFPLCTLHGSWDMRFIYT